MTAREVLSGVLALAVALRLAVWLLEPVLPIVAALLVFYLAAGSARARRH